MHCHGVECYCQFPLLTPILKKSGIPIQIIYKFRDCGYFPIQWNEYPTTMRCLYSVYVEDFVVFMLVYCSIIVCLYTLVRFCDLSIVKSVHAIATNMATSQNELSQVLVRHYSTNVHVININLCAHCSRLSVRVTVCWDQVRLSR